MISADNFWSLDEVCLFLGVSRRTLYRLIKQGKLKPEKKEGKLFFIPDEVKDYKYLQNEINSLPSGRIFRAEALNYYFNTARKYRIIRKPSGVYWIKIKPEYIIRHNNEIFKNIKCYLCKLVISGGVFRLVIIPTKYFKRMPQTEQERFLKYEFNLKDVL